MMRSNKHIFFFPIWGESYINNFINICIPCFIESLTLFDNIVSKNFTIQIWTKIEDIKIFEKSPNIIKLKKKINITYIMIPNKIFKLYFLNKYDFLNLLQSLAITANSLKFDYIWFIYPDFIFNKKSLKNIYLKTQKDFEAIYIPVPQAIEEPIKEIIKNRGVLYIAQNLKKILEEYMHPIVKICTYDNLKTTTPSLFFSHKKNEYMMFRYYHMHPICLKLDLNNYELFRNFNTTLDGGFLKNLKKIYVAKNDKFAICISLLKLKAIKLPEIKDLRVKNVGNILLNWCIENINSLHIKISKFEYLIKYKNFNFKKYLITKKKLENLVVDLNNKVNKKIQITKDDTFSFEMSSSPVVKYNQSLFYKFYINNLLNLNDNKSSILKKFLQESDNENNKKFISDIYNEVIK